MICAIITSSGANSGYCELAIKTLLSQETNENVVPSVLDFSGEPELFSSLPKNVCYVNRKGKGFCSNVNYGIGLAALIGANSLLYLNDDVRLPSHFVDRAIKTISSEGVGFVAGVQQVSDVACVPLEYFQDLELPKSVNVVTEIDDLMGKWGDFSAWLADVDMLMKVGPLDEKFDPVGILADNDYLLRIRKAGYTPKRDHGIGYLHAKGVTQRKYRPDWPYDDVLMSAKRHFMNKWGVDPYNGKIEDVYEREFGD